MTRRWEITVAVAGLVAGPALLLWDRSGPVMRPVVTLPVVRPVPDVAIVRRLFGSGVNDPGVPDVVAGTEGVPALVGIVGRLPDAAVALVRGEDGRSRTVAVGGETDGWRLQGLAADQAVFARGGARVRVRLAAGQDQ